MKTMIPHEWIWGTFWGDQWEGEREKKGYWRVKRIDVCDLYTREDSIVKLTKHFFWKKEGVEEWYDDIPSSSLGLTKIPGP
jgi:hypothetical protein